MKDKLLGHLKALPSHAGIKEPFKYTINEFATHLLQGMYLYKSASLTVAIQGHIYCVKCPLALSSKY